MVRRLHLERPRHRRILHSPRRFEMWVILVLAVLLLVPAASVSAAPYTFTPIAVSNGTFDPFGFGTPALNNAGVVVFNATLNDGNFTDGIFRSSGGPITTIAIENGFARFGTPSINTSGQVGFEASL